MFLAKGELQNTVNQYQRMMDLFPSDPQPPTRLASILYAANHKLKASELLQLVLAEHPDYTDALLLSAQMFSEEKRFRLAAANAEHITPSDPKKYIDAQRILARAHLELKNYDKAIEASKRFLESYPNNLTTTMGLAYAYQKSGDRDRAIEYYRTASDLDPDSHLPDLYLGSLFAQFDDVDSAIDSFKTAMAKVPDDHTIGNNLAMLYIQRGTGEDIEEAYTLADNLRKRYPDDATIIDTYGWVLYHREEYELAKEAFTRSIESDSSNPSFHYHLGKTLFALGEVESANLSLLKALRHNSSF